jgi:hypothetical protein
MNDGCTWRRRSTLKATMGTVAILLTTSSWHVALEAARADGEPGGVLFSEGFEDARLFQAAGARIAG